MKLSLSLIMLPLPKALPTVIPIAGRATTLQRSPGATWTPVSGNVAKRNEGYRGRGNTLGLGLDPRDPQGSLSGREKVKSRLEPCEWG